jgi:hypothetical protein
MNDATPENAPSTRRRAGLLWACGAVAAIVLTLGVTGTLSSWTSAIITNDDNTAKAAASVILSETDGTATCTSNDDQTATNSYTCSTINKYGGIAVPLDPGSTQSVTVTMENLGTAAGSLVLDAGACTASGGNYGDPGVPSLCAAMTVTVECPGGTPVHGTSTLDAFDAAPASTASASLGAGSSLSCTFTVALPAAADPALAGQAVSQPLTWTLTATP